MADQDSKRPVYRLERLPAAAKIPAAVLDRYSAEIARRDPFIDWEGLIRTMRAAERAMVRSDALVWAASQDGFPVYVDWYNVVRDMTDWRYKDVEFTIDDLQRLVAKHAYDQPERTSEQVAAARDHSRRELADDLAKLAILAARGMSLMRTSNQ